MSRLVLTPLHCVARTAPSLIVLAAALAAGAAPLDPADAPREDVGIKISDVEREITSLRGEDRSKSPHAAPYAEKLAGELQRLRDEWEGVAAPAAGPAGPELYVVGFYEGSMPDGPRKFGTAVVEVQVTERPVVIALCAYEPIRWDLRLAEGARVEKVIVGGYGDQQLAAPPRGVAVEKHTHKPREGERYFYTYPGGESPTHLQAVATLRGLTGLSVTTLQGAYRYGGRPIIVGHGDVGWRRQRVMNRLEPLWREATAPRRAEARQSVAGVPFQAIRWSGEWPIRTKAELADFTPRGWFKGTLRVLPRRINRVAVDPRGPAWFGIEGHSSVARFDLNAGNATEIVIEEDIPELSWPCGIAFDTKRNRLVVATLGGQGYLYAYDPTADTWSLLRTMNNVDLQSLAYSAEEDCLYGLTMTHGQRGKLEVCQFSADGALDRRFTIDAEASASPSEAFTTPPQLIAAGRNLVLLLPPPMGMRPDERAAPGEGPGMKCLVIDPKAGEVTYADELVEIEPAAAAAKADGRRLKEHWDAVRLGRDADSGKASQALAAGGDAAVAAVRLDLPRPAPAPEAAAVRDQIARLDHADWKQREEAASWLVANGGAAEADLAATRDAAKSHETAQQLDAALKQIRLVRDGVMPPAQLDDSVGDPAIRTRLRAVRVLARIGTPAAVRLLREIAGGPAGSIDSIEARRALSGM